jgi:hypothetical protein
LVNVKELPVPTVTVTDWLVVDPTIVPPTEIVQLYAVIPAVPV